MKTEVNFEDADGFYEQLINAHADLNAEQSELLNTRLILILANQLGDTPLLQACIAAARQADPA